MILEADTAGAENDSGSHRKARYWRYCLVAVRGGGASWRTVPGRSRWLQERKPELQLIPCVNGEREKQVRALVESLSVSLPVTIIRGRSREVMAASDAVLLASGTATLEAMLLKKPMVVGCRLSNLSWAILSRIVKITHVALPNLLWEQPLVPELLQDDASPECLGTAYWRAWKTAAPVRSRKRPSPNCTISCAVMPATGRQRLLVVCWKGNAVSRAPYPV